MKRLKIIGLALLALFALGALLASTAAALEEGFLPLNMRHFNVLAGTATLETTNKEAVVCKKVSGSGEFALSTEKKPIDHHGTGTLDFDECTILGFPATSLGDEKQLILVPVLFLICLIDSAKLLFGIYVEPTAATVHLEAPAVGALIEVKGPVIGHILPQADEIARTLWSIDFTGKEGKQNITECKDIAGGVKKGNLLAKKDPAAEFLKSSENAEKGLIQFLEAQLLMD